jgi:glycosyltransferase involved in cell wall biosynthesis
VSELARIVHLGPDPDGPGGMPAVVRDLLASPLAERYRMEAIPTYRPSKGLRRLGIFLGSLVRLTRWCAGPGERLVHVHSAVRGSLYRKSVCVAVARLMRRPVILHIHAGAGDIADFDQRLDPARRWIFSRAMRLADRVLSVSAAGAAEIERRFGQHGIVVVPNAAPRVAELGPPPGETDARVLYLGGFEDPAKGGAVMLRALEGIRAGAPDARVSMAGPGELPPGAALGDGVDWNGWLDTAAKEAALAGTDVVVFPSISEGLPVALLEAMAHGRAVVATRVGGMPEVVTDGEDGLLVPGQDPEALAEAIVRLARDPAERVRLGAAARARAQRLNDHEVTDRLDGIYRDVLAGAARAR